MRLYFLLIGFFLIQTIKSQENKPFGWGKPLIFVEKKPEKPKKVYTNYGHPIKDLIDSAGIDKSDLQFVVYKKDRIFNIMVNHQILKSYPIVLGFNPVGDKQQEGDGKTPEGTYRIRSKRYHNNWTRFIWIDYPNEDSYEKFSYNKACGVIPKSATIGGEVGIHGVPYEKDEIISKGYDWTLGCISLKTNDIKELYDVISSNSYVTIYP